jgi:hypothetical protein
MTLRSPAAALLCALSLTIACKDDPPAPAPAPTPAVTDMPAATTADAGKPAAPLLKKTPPPDARFGSGIGQKPSEPIPSKDLDDGKEAAPWKSRALKTQRLYKASGQASIVASISSLSRAVIMDNTSTCEKQRKHEPLDFVLVDTAKGKEINHAVQLLGEVAKLGALYTEQVKDEVRATSYISLIDGEPIAWLTPLDKQKIEVLGDGAAAWITVMRPDGRVAAARLAENMPPAPPPPPKKRSKEPPPEPPAPFAEPKLATSFVPDALWPTEAALMAAQVPEKADDCVLERLAHGKDAPECVVKGSDLDGYVHTHWLKGFGIFEDKNNGWTIALDLTTGERSNPVPGECSGAALTTVSSRTQEPRLLFQCTAERSEATYAVWSPAQSWVVRDSSALLFKEPVFRDGLVTVGVGAGRKGTPRAAYILDALRGKLYRSFQNEDLDPARSPLAPFVYDLEPAVFDADYAHLSFDAGEIQLLTKWRCEQRFAQLFNSERILAFGCIDDRAAEGAPIAIKDVLVLDLKTWSRINTKLIPVSLDGDTLYLVEAKYLDPGLKPCDNAVIHAAKL